MMLLLTTKVQLHIFIIRGGLQNVGRCELILLLIFLMFVFPRKNYSSLWLLHFSNASQMLLKCYTIIFQLRLHNTTLSNFYYSFKTNLQKLIVCARNSLTIDGRPSVEVMV